jgi:uncharacterized OB-fold protein
MDTAPSHRMLPVTDDLDTGPFFAAAREHRLVVQRCARCGTVLHVPRAYCHHCGSWDTRWDEVPGRGALYTWTTVAHQVHPAYPVPYTVVVVKLEELDVNLIGSLPGAPELRAGQPMEVWWEDLDGVVLPNWRPAADPA